MCLFPPKWASKLASYSPSIDHLGTLQLRGNQIQTAPDWLYFWLMEMCCDWWDLIFRFIMKRHQGSFVFHPKESHRSSSLHHHLRPPCWFSEVQLCLRKRLVKAGRQLLSEYFGRFMQGWGWLVLVGCLSISLRKGGGREGGRREGRGEDERALNILYIYCKYNIYILQMQHGAKLAQYPMK